MFYHQWRLAGRLKLCRDEVGRKTDGAVCLSVCLSQPLSTGRCSMLSPTIILPLIQLLALLHWPPIGSRFGGMHRLHLPAARISAFLNKAPPLAPPLPSPPSTPPSIPPSSRTLTWLPRITCCCCLDGKHMALLGCERLI